MPRKTSKKIIDQMRDEYINSNCTYGELSAKYGIGKRTIDEIGRTENWKQLRKDTRYTAFAIAKEALSEKLAESTVNWDSDIIDMVNILKDNLHRLLQIPKHDKTGHEIPLSANEANRITDTLAKLNDIQRKTTERDIHRVQAIDPEKMEEMRALLLGEA